MAESIKLLHLTMMVSKLAKGGIKVKVKAVVDVSSVYLRLSLYVAVTASSKDCSGSEMVYSIALLTIKGSVS